MENQVDRQKTIEQLAVPPRARRALARLCDVVVAAQGDNVRSICLVGSAATTDFSAAVSDINLLVVFAQLELADLAAIAPQAQRPWRRERISPRFISERNLREAVSVFPLDFWTMQQHHVLLHGHDLLRDLPLARGDLLWQLRHEVRGLRMRLKQQYWRTYRSVRHAAPNLRSDVTAVIHLLRGMTFLAHPSVPGPALAALPAQAAEAWGIDRAAFEELLAVRRNLRPVRSGDIFRLYDNLLGIVRRMDESLAGLRA